MRKMKNVLAGWLIRGINSKTKDNRQAMPNSDTGDCTENGKIEKLWSKDI